MITKVVKKDGRKVNFEVEKIAKSIYKAANSIGGQNYAKSENLANIAVEKLESKQENRQVSTEEIEKVVKQVLKENEHNSTLNAYINYRLQRDAVRTRKSEIVQTMEKLTFQDAKDSNIKRENANINADTPMGTMLKYGSETAKSYYQLCVLKPAHSKAHRNGDIHIHDLDF